MPEERRSEIFCIFDEIVQDDDDDEDASIYLLRIIMRNK